MTRLTRISVLLAALLVPGLATAQTAGDAEDSSPFAPVDEGAPSDDSDDEGEAADDTDATDDDAVTEDEATDPEATDDDAEESAESEDEPAEQPPLPDDAWGYGFIDLADYERMSRVTGFDVTPLMACIEAEEAGNRERRITRTVPMTIYVLDDLSLHVSYNGDDPEFEVAECFSQAVGGMELEPAPEDLAQSRYGWTYYDYTFTAKQRMRRGEIIGLYTLSGVAAGIAIGSFTAARNDEAELADRLAEGSTSPISRRHLEQRPDRFRATAWSMVGVSVVSFVGATLLQTAHRDIERRENPTLVFSPGSPTGDLGFTLSSRF